MPWLQLMNWRPSTRGILPVDTHTHNIKSVNLTCDASVGRLPAGCSDAELRRTLQASLKRWRRSVFENLVVVANLCRIARQPRIATKTLQDTAQKARGFGSNAIV